MLEVKVASYYKCSEAENIVYKMCHSKWLSNFNPDIVKLQELLKTQRSLKTQLL